MTGVSLEKPHMITADDPAEQACTSDGLATHDWRVVEYKEYPKASKTSKSLVCVWCHAVACGEPTQSDPCWLAYHHKTPHLSRHGETWPIGGARK